jgi:HEAT repeat protein
MKETEKYTTNLMGGRVSVQSLIRDLKSPNSFVRWEAAWGLQDTKDKNVVEHLAKALNGIDQEVRFAAATVLGWIRDEKAVEPLIKRLKDNVDEVRLAAIKALGKIGDEKASAPLALHLENEDVHDAMWMAGLESLLMIYEKKKS